jgi:hypothetical protein
MVASPTMAGEYVRSTFVVWRDSDGIRFRRTFPGLLAALWILLASLWVSSCCVAPPRPQDLLSLGYRTPEQAFSTFQTAVRADDPGLLRLCLSADFKARNKLSEQVMREYWDRLKKQQPFLRKGLADALPEGPAEVRGDRARLRAKSHGHSITLVFAREEFCEAWGGGEKLADESAPFRKRTGMQEGAQGERWIYGRMPLPPGVAIDRVTELRFGQEWKIDDFAMDDEKKDESAAVRKSDDLVP